MRSERQHLIEEAIKIRAMIKQLEALYESFYKPIVTTELMEEPEQKASLKGANLEIKVRKNYPYNEDTEIQNLTELLKQLKAVFKSEAEKSGNYTTTTYFETTYEDPSAELEWNERARHTIFNEFDQMVERIMSDDEAE